MTQAPATTIATAVRQHGGGRHPLNLLCTAQAGRLQDSRGGVINRRAEGATSSHPLPASCAAAAHPTTGVRRARELSPSLCSQNRQHAQLVEGYRPYATRQTSRSATAFGLEISFYCFKRFCRHPNLMAQLWKRTCSTKGESDIPIRDFDIRDKQQYVLSNSHARQPNKVNRPQECTLSFQVDEPVQNTLIPPTVVFTKAMYEPTSSRAYAGGDLQNQGDHNFILLMLGSLNLKVLPIRNPDSSQYRRNRTNCLNPGGPDLSGIYSQHNYVGGRKDQDNTGHRDRQVLLCPSPAALVPHPYHLDDLEHRPSLPAPCHHVQRGAA
ncbi:hypothetical protein L0Y47_21575 [Ectopseudomonas composti]